MVDLGTNCALRRVLLHPRGDGTNAGKGFPADFTIQVCREGEPWRVVVEKRDYPAPLDGEAQVIRVEGTEGRYVKVEATRLRAVEPGTHRFQLAEIAVFGETAAPPPLAGQPATAEGPTTVARLRCENRDNPVGIDAAQPRFSWWMQSSIRGQRQTAYRILLASSEARLAQDDGDLWDSGKVTSDRSIAVVYGGRPLRSGQTYWWKVMLWDKDEQRHGLERAGAVPDRQAQPGRLARPVDRRRRRAQPGSRRRAGFRGRGAGCRPSRVGPSRSGFGDED